MTTQPSGATLPLRMHRLPTGLIGLSSGRITSWPGVSTAVAASSASVRAGRGELRAVDVAALYQALRDHRDAAGAVDVGGDMHAARLEVGQ